MTHKHIKDAQSCFWWEKSKYTDVPFLTYQIEQNVKNLTKHTIDGSRKTVAPMHW